MHTLHKTNIHEYFRCKLTVSTTAYATCRSIGAKFTPQGSLVISRVAETACMLEQRAEDLCAEGIDAKILSPAQCAELEPLLHVPEAGAGLRVATDFQLDARSASEYLLQRCNDLGRPGGRFRMHFGCKVHHISMDCCSGACASVITSRGDVRTMCAPIYYL